LVAGPPAARRVHRALPAAVDRGAARERTRDPHGLAREEPVRRAEGPGRDRRERAPWRLQDRGRERDVRGLPNVTLVDELAAARIGTTYNQYATSEVRRNRLRAYLASRAGAPILLVGEAAGYRGARISGIAFTSERQLTGDGPAEATATIVHRVLAELGVEDEVLLWNVVPTHPGSETSNRRPTRDEVEAAFPFLD